MGAGELLDHLFEPFALVQDCQKGFSAWILKSVPEVGQNIEENHKQLFLFSTCLVGECDLSAPLCSVAFQEVLQHMPDPFKADWKTHETVHHSLAESHGHKRL